MQYKLWIEPNGFLKTWHLKQEVAAQSDENAKLKARNLAVEAEIKDLKEGTAAIEERSRSDLGMVKKGETFYQFVTPEKSGK